MTDNVFQFTVVKSTERFPVHQPETPQDTL